LSSKWLNINEDVACKRIITCTNVAELRNRPVGKQLYEIRCKWETVKLVTRDWILGSGRGGESSYSYKNRYCRLY
jgi:hypothetical protein